MQQEKPESKNIPKARNIDWFIALGLFALFSLVYWLTIGKDPSIDSFVTAHWVNSTAQLNWFHPHHLLFSYACRFVNVIYQTLFPPLDLLMLLTRCIHILGGLGIGLIYLRLYAMRVPSLKAASIAIVIGVSYGMWLFSTIFELVIPYFVMFLAGWAAVHRWGQASRWSAFAAGMVLGAGVLIHQTLLIYLPAFLILIFMLGERRTRWQQAFFYCFGSMAVICAGYITAFLVLGLDFPSGWFKFFTDYAHKGAFQHGTMADIVTSAKNIISIWLYPILYADYFSYRYMAALVFLAAMVAVAIIRTLHKNAFSAFCLAVFGIAFAFFTWWSPDTLDFYLIPAIFILLPAFLLIKWRYLPAVILALSVWMFLFNNLPEMRRRNAPILNCVMETDRRLAIMLKPQDKVFMVDQYLDACAAYLEMQDQFNLTVENYNERENLELFIGYAKNAYDYAVYFDGMFGELVKKSGVLAQDKELASLMALAKKAVFTETCSQSLVIWKIQR